MMLFSTKAEYDYSIDAYVVELPANAMAKRFVTDVAFKAANEALQIHGCYGYLVDFGLEKIVRDLRVHQILEGTNEIMRVIVARHMLAER